MKKPKIESVTLGTFEVTGDKLVVSDPCYELGTWCMGIDNRNIEEKM